MAENTIRWKVIDRIITLADERPELVDVTIDGTGYPGDTAGPECIYLGDLNGELTVPVTRAEGERATYNDKFEIVWGIDIHANGKSREETMARADQVIGAFQDVIANDSQIAGLDGVLSARLSDQKGPLGVDVRGVGLVVVAHLTVAIHARYTS